MFFSLSLLVCDAQGVVAGHASDTARVPYLIVKSHDGSAPCPCSESSALHHVSRPWACSETTHREQVSTFPLGALYGGNRRSIIAKSSFAPNREIASLSRRK